MVNALTRVRPDLVPLWTNLIWLSGRCNNSSVKICLTHFSTGNMIRLLKSPDSCVTWGKVYQPGKFSILELCNFLLAITRRGFVFLACSYSNLGSFGSLLMVYGVFHWYRMSIDFWQKGSLLTVVLLGAKCVAFPSWPFWDSFFCSFCTPAFSFFCQFFSM